MSETDAGRAAALAVLICTRNRADLLEQTLAGLARQTVERSAYEIIVVDDGSTDHTAAVVESFCSTLPLTYVPQRPAGLASARNHCLFRTLAPIVLFLDDDDVPAPELLARHLDVHRRYPADHYAVLGHTALSPINARDPLMHYVTEVGCFLFSYPSLEDGDVRDFSYFWGGRSSCKRRFLLEHGVFNPVFTFGCEDIELGFRLSKHGLRVVYDAQALTTMTRSIGVEAFCDRLTRQGRSNYLFSELHPEPVVLDWTEVRQAEHRWAATASDYPLMFRSACLLDRMARLKSELGFALDPREQAVLFNGYGRVLRAAKLKGIAEAAAESRGATGRDEAPALRWPPRDALGQPHVGTANRRPGRPESPDHP